MSVVFPEVFLPIVAHHHVLSCVLTQEAECSYSRKALWGHCEVRFSTPAPKPTKVSQTPRIIPACPLFLFECTQHVSTGTFISMRRPPPAASVHSGCTFLAKVLQQAALMSSD